MGNASKKQKGEIASNRLQQTYFSQLSLQSNFPANLSARSAVSAASQQSACSVSRPWSRVSRRRWHHSTLNDPLNCAKTAWPVPHVEALFLPEFKIHGNVTEQHFEIIDTISKGAFGKVYKVRKKDTKEIYALKILSKSQVISDKAIRQVKDEVHIQSVCGHHPFIVNCPFYWQSRKHLFIVSDYVPGGELLELCQQLGPLPEELVRIYVVEIALALDFLHNAGVIYRDLKLENILLDDECHAQLIDFGLAKWLKYGSKTTTICGTLQYMAPEVASMEPYGHAADWWSLGVVMCCLICSQPPAAAWPDAGGGGEDRGQPGALPEDACLSEAARLLLQRLLDPSPRSRLASLTALQNTAFLHHVHVADVRSKKLSPRRILESHFQAVPEGIRSSHFEGFESDLRES